MSDPDMTINEWCARRKYSRSTFYKLKKAGKAPEILEAVEGCPRITEAADAEWEKARKAEKREADAMEGA